MYRLRLLILFSLLISSCTTGRWTVADENAVDTNEQPEVIRQETLLLVEQYPTVENPVIAFSPYAVTTKEYTQRIKVERNIQRYRPRGAFLITALAGAAFSFIAANSDAVMPSASVSQKVAMNLAGGLLGVLSVVNLEPTGEPIQTGESRLMRKSGTEIIQDTTQSLQWMNNTADVTVRYNGDVIFNQPEAGLSQNRLELNLGAFASEVHYTNDENPEITVELDFLNFNRQVNVPIRDFLSRYIRVTAPVALLRNFPERSETNIITEIGEGSQLKFIARESGGWYRVQYGGSEVYMQQDDVEIEWISTFDSGPALLVEFAEIPYGEIDVEKMVPILKTQNIRDRGIIISNSRNNQIGNRQYLDRDHRLFRQYLQTALQIHENRVQVFENEHPDEWANTLSNMPDMYEEGSLLVYLSGFASVRNGEIMLSFKDEDGALTQTPLSIVFESLKDTRPGALYLFIDLEYHQEEIAYENASNSNRYRSILERAAGVITRDLPNSVIVFSSLPNQKSALFTGLSAEENKRHHIFNYYLAEALQQRKTRISELIRHLQNNVDYTSRRLHDRPQEIRVFGNMSLNLAE